MAEVRIVGAEVRTELDLHRSLERQLELGDYGRNVAALRDRLLTDVPRPVRIVWLDSRISRSRLGEEVFDKMVGVFAEVVAQDLAFRLERTIRVRASITRVLSRSAGQPDAGSGHPATHHYR